MYTGPNIVRDGLILQFDPANIKCFRGEPTVNYVVLASTMGNCGSYSNGNDGTFLTEFGTIGYRITHRTSWNGLHTGIFIPIAGTYTISAYFRYLGGTANNNGATVYTSGGGITDRAVGLNKSLVGVWQRVSMTNTYTGSFTFYMISYGGNTSDWSSWEVTMPQVEQKDHATPFVNGTRGTTVSTGGGLIDLSNNGNHGELVNGVLYDSSNCGSLKFDGVDDYVIIPYNYNINNATAFTIECILYSNNISREQGIFSTSKFDLSSGWHIEIYQSKLVFQIFPSQYYTFSTKLLESNKYYHCCLTYTNGTVVYYVDGENSGIMSNYNITPSNSNIEISKFGGMFYGKLPIIRFYNRALSQSEIQHNYNSMKSRYI